MSKEDIVKFGTMALVVEAHMGRPPSSAALAALLHPELEGDDERVDITQNT